MWVSVGRGQNWLGSDHCEEGWEENLKKRRLGEERGGEELGCTLNLIRCRRNRNGAFLLCPSLKGQWRDIFPPFFSSKASTLDPDLYPKFFSNLVWNSWSYWGLNPCCIMQRGVKSMIVAEIFPMPNEVGSKIFQLHFAVGRCDSLLHDAAGSQILPLHDAAWSQILPPHDAAGSKFGSGESSLNTFEDSLGS